MQQRAMTLQEKIDLVSALALFPALTIMVFLRRKLGYRFLSPIRYQVMTLLLLALGGFAVASGNQLTGIGIIIFAVVMFVLATVQRSQQWKDIRRGVSWHTYSRGIPWLSALPLPETSVKRFIDPLAAVIAGVLLAIPLNWLGFYIIVSGVCIYIFESQDYQRSINLMLDQLDGLVESEVTSDNMAYYRQGAAAQERPVEETAGIATGSDPDLAAAINRRRNRASGTLQSGMEPPDNLAAI